MIKRVVEIIIAAAIVAYFSSAVLAAGCQGTEFSFCSKTFYASAPCNGLDELASIGRNNCPRGPGKCAHCASGQDCPLIESWEPTEIAIIGIEITIFDGHQQLSYAYAGNGYHPNQMAFVGPGQSHVAQWFGQGMAFKLPAAGVPGYIDLHISCRSGGRAQAFYTIYYSVIRGQAGE
jgi:hypothetical protein